MAFEIVVGIGGDGSGFQAARTAARWCSAVGGTVILVFGYEAAVPGPRGGALEEEIAAVGQEAIDRLRPELTAAFPDVSIDVELVGQRPVDALIAVAELRGAQAIAVGHGGSGPLRAALLGSITYEIVHRAPLPVLVVPNDDSDTD